MDLHHEAEAHLRTIRTLMERATVYRAISAPTALVAGLLGLVCGLIPLAIFLDQESGSYRSCKTMWLAALVLVLGVNAWFIHRDAGRRGDPFFSPGMRLALRAVAPPALCGLVATLQLDYGFLPGVWMCCYGLTLLATAPFAPGSISRLGWAFLLSGLAYGLLGFFRFQIVSMFGDVGALTVFMICSAQHAMALTFGGYHLVYAGFVGFRGARSDAAAVV